MVDDNWRRNVPVLVEPRILVEDDAPWLIYLCKKRYSHRYDQIGTEQWFRNIVLKQPGVFLAIRTQNAFLIALIAFIPWTPTEPECNVAFLCCDDGCMWEGLKLLRTSIDWAKMRRCAVWRMSSDTTYDFSALARRIGAVDRQHAVFRFGRDFFGIDGDRQCDRPRKRSGGPFAAMNRFAHPRAGRRLVALDRQHISDEQDLDRLGIDSRQINLD